MTRFEEMDARGMFDELGYELTEDSKKYLRYVKYENKEHKIYGGEFIDFEKINREFRLTRKTCQGNTHFRYAGMRELQAINKQVEELGWLSD